MDEGRTKEVWKEIEWTNGVKRQMDVYGYDTQDGKAYKCMGASETQISNLCQPCNKRSLRCNMKKQSGGTGLASSAANISV